MRHRYLKKKIPRKKFPKRAPVTMGRHAPVVEDYATEHSLEAVTSPKQKARSNMEFTINEPVRSDSGLPVRNCACGGQQSTLLRELRSLTGGHRISPLVENRWSREEEADDIFCMTPPAPDYAASASERLVANVGREREEEFVYDAAPGTCEDHEMAGLTLNYKGLARNRQRELEERRQQESRGHVARQEPVANDVDDVNAMVPPTPDYFSMCSPYLRRR